MRTAIVALGAALFCGLSGAVLASYADDRADIETVMTTWADDGVLEWVGGVENGKAAIRKAMSNFAGGRPVAIPEGATSRPRTHHQLANHVIDVNGNTAKTVAYWYNITNSTPQKDVQLMYFGHYEDELVKVNGQWFFKKRKIYNEGSARWQYKGGKNPAW